MLTLLVIVDNHTHILSCKKVANDWLHFDNQDLKNLSHQMNNKIKGVFLSFPLETEFKCFYFHFFTFPLPGLLSLSINQSDESITFGDSPQKKSVKDLCSN